MGATEGYRAEAVRLEWVRCVGVGVGQSPPRERAGHGCGDRGVTEVVCSLSFPRTVRKTRVTITW